MTNVACFHEVIENVYKIKHINMKGKEIRPTKNQTIIIKKGDIVGSRTLKRMTFWGRFFIIGDILTRIGWGYETVPLFRTSYKSGEILPWEKDKEIQITPELLKAISEEDSLKELASLKTKMDELIIWFIMGTAIGGLGSYFLFNGGLDAFNSVIG